MTIDANTVQLFGMFFTFLSLVFTGLIGVYQIVLKAKQETIGHQIDSAAAMAGVAATRVSEVKEDLRVSVEERSARLDGLATEVAEVKQLGKETHVLVDGQMGRVLDIGLKAARLLAAADPSKANLHDLEVAEKAKREHDAKMKVVEVSAAAGASLADAIVADKTKTPPDK